MKPKIILFILVLGSCRKYDEGGKYYKAGERLQGTWTLRAFTVDGEDSLSALSTCLVNNNNIRFITKPGHGLSRNSAFFVKAGNAPYCWEGACDLTNNKNTLTFNSSYGSSLFYPFCMDNRKWDIIKLTESELKLSRVSVQGYTYVIRMGK
jgi:hypothetical protein